MKARVDKAVFSTVGEFSEIKACGIELQVHGDKPTKTVIVKKKRKKYKKREKKLAQN